MMRETINKFFSNNENYIPTCGFTTQWFGDSKLSLADQFEHMMSQDATNPEAGMVYNLGMAFLDAEKFTKEDTASYFCLSASGRALRPVQENQSTLDFGVYPDLESVLGFKHVPNYMKELMPVEAIPFVHATSKLECLAKAHWFHLHGWDRVNADGRDIMLHAGEQIQKACTSYYTTPTILSKATSALNWKYHSELNLDNYLNESFPEYDKAVDLAIQGQCYYSSYVYPQAQLFLASFGLYREDASIGDKLAFLDAIQKGKLGSVEAVAECQANHPLSVFEKYKSANDAPAELKEQWEFEHAISRAINNAENTFFVRTTEFAKEMETALTNTVTKIGLTMSNMQKAMGEIYNILPADLQGQYVEVLQHTVTPCAKIDAAKEPLQALTCYQQATSSLNSVISEWNQANNDNVLLLDSGNINVDLPKNYKLVELAHAREIVSTFLASVNDDPEIVAGYNKSIYDNNGRKITDVALHLIDQGLDIQADSLGVASDIVHAVAAGYCTGVGDHCEEILDKASMMSQMTKKAYDANLQEYENVTSLQHMEKYLEYTLADVVQDYADPSTFTVEG